MLIAHISEVYSDYLLFCNSPTFVAFWRERESERDSFATERLLLPFRPETTAATETNIIAFMLAKVLLGTKLL